MVGLLVASSRAWRSVARLVALCLVLLFVPRVARAAFTPGPVDHLVLAAGNGAVAGTPTNVTVSAVDAAGFFVAGSTGTVHFTSTDPGATLPADAALTDGTGVFLATFARVGPQTVTATDTVTASITGTSGVVPVTAAAVDHITLNCKPPSVVAGASVACPVVAWDQFDNVATSYSGTVHISSSDPQAVLPADFTVVGGIGPTSFTLETAGLQSVTVTDVGTPQLTGTRTTTVTPGDASTLVVSAPATATAGASFSFTVTARDAFGNVATGYAGTVTVASTDAQAVLPASSTLTAGTGTFSAVLKTAGNQRLTVNDNVGTSEIPSGDIAVVAAAGTHFAVSGPASATAGAGFGFTVTALDPFGDTATSYSGTVHFTSSDGNATLPVDATLTNGAGTFSATLKTAGGQTLTATDTASASFTGTSSTITVAAGAAAGFVVVAPAQAIEGIAFSVVITAVDAWNNLAAGYAGTVHFTSSDPAAVLPTDATLTGGSGSLPSTLTTAGSQTITVTDTLTPAITGTSGPIGVGASATTTTVTSSGSPSVFGQNVAFTATVGCASCPTPTGQVSFTIDGTAQPPVTLGGGGVAVLSLATVAGAHTIAVAYLGDASHTGSTASTTQDVTKASTATTLTVSPNPSVSGQLVTSQATVAAVAPGGGKPSGVVTFFDGATSLGSAILDASAVAKLTVPLAVGPHSITAHYAGGTSFLASVSGLEQVTTTKSSTTTQLTTSGNPAIVGQAVTFAAQVACDAPGVGAPTGTVSFVDGSTALGSSLIDAFGQATLRATDLAVGTHPITAIYGGDAQRSGSSSSVLSETVATSAAAVNITSSANPSPRGAVVSFSATVVAVGTAGTPTGTVTFTDGTTTLGQSSLVAGGAEISTGALGGGSHAITATYSGDGSFVGGYATLLETITQAGTTITLGAAPSSTTFGEPITLTGTVSSSGPTPSGDVSFYDGDSQLGSAPLIGTFATLVTSSLPVGTHTLHAIFVATTDFASSRSSDISVDVKDAVAVSGDAGAPVDADAGASSAPADAGVGAPATPPGASPAPIGLDAGGLAPLGIGGNGSDDCSCRAVGGESSRGTPLALAWVLGCAVVALGRRRARLLR